MAVEIAVLELDPGALWGLGDEAHLDLAGPAGVGLDLPLRADVPGKGDALGRLVGEHPRPLALAPVDAAVVDATTSARFEHRLGDVDREHVVLAGLDLVELLGEDAECTLDRRLDEDLCPNRGLLCLGGHPSSS